MAGDLEGRGGQWAEQSRLRISDDDRHRVSEFLREAAGEGRLDMEELEERLEAAYAAKTYGELVPLTSDLPMGAQQRPAAPATPPVSKHGAPTGPLTRYDTSIAILGGTSRTGSWEVGATHNAFSLMGGVDIDLRNARFTSQETVINAYAFWGGIDIYVNAQTRVIVDGIGIMGAFDQARDKVEADLGPDSPVVRVTGLALMAGITVQRKPMPGEGKRRRMLGH